MADMDVDTAWLNNLLKKRNLDQGDLARAINKHRTRGNRICMGKRPIYPKEIKAVAGLLGVPMTVVARRVGLPVEEQETPTATDKASSTQEIETGDFGDEYVKIAGYDIRFAAGSGTLETDDARTGFHIFRHEWLRKISNAPSEKLVVVMVAGDSMWQTLHHGDHVLVDRTVTNIGRDGIYILRSGDELQVKRVQLQPDNLLTIKSDNPDYEIFRNVVVEDVEILGRVIWLGRQV